MDADVRLVGPLFDGRAERVVDLAVQESERAVAESAARQVRALVGRRAMHPTGHYAARTVVDHGRVHTPGLRYAAWLEGDAPRNARSRFKGYRIYQDAARETAARAPAIAGEVIGRAIRAING